MSRDLPEFAEEVLDDLELLRARDPRGAAAGGRRRRRAGARDRPADRGGRPRPGHRRRPAARAGDRRPARGRGRRAPCCARCSARAARSPSTSSPGPTLPVWTGPSDICVVATRTGAGRYAVTPAYEAARRGRRAARHRRRGRAAARGLRRPRARPYVPLPRSRVRHTTLWSLLTPLLRLATELGPAARGGRRPRGDRRRARRGRRRVRAGPGVVRQPGEDPRARTARRAAGDRRGGPARRCRGGPGGRPAGHPGRAARSPPSGCPTSGSRCPRCSGARWRPRDAGRLLPRPRRGRPAAGCGCSPSGTPTPAGTTARRARAAVGGGGDGRGRCGRRGAHGVPVSALAEHGDPERFARLPRLARQLAVADFTAVYLALALDTERARGA